MKRRKSKKSFSRAGWLLLWTAVALALFWWAWQNDRRRMIRRWFIDDTKYAAEIKAAAVKHDLPPQLVRALIRRESAFDASAEGRAGEIGLMQLLPSGAAAEWARVNKKPPFRKKELFAIPVNLDIGCWYLGRALKRWQKYRDREILALAEYNAGAKNAARWKPDDFSGDALAKVDFPGTREYILEIMGNYRRYLAESGGEKNL